MRFVAFNLSRCFYLVMPVCVLLLVGLFSLLFWWVLGYYIWCLVCVFLACCLWFDFVAYVSVSCSSVWGFNLRLDLLMFVMRVWCMVVPTALDFKLVLGLLRACWFGVIVGCWLLFTYC